MSSCLGIRHSYHNALRRFHRTNVKTIVPALRCLIPRLISYCTLQEQFCSRSFVAGRLGHVAEQGARPAALPVRPSASPQRGVGAVSCPGLRFASAPDHASRLEQQTAVHHHRRPPQGTHHRHLVPIRSAAMTRLLGRISIAAAIYTFPLPRLSAKLMVDMAC